ncbi:MAG TPA: Vms1/Ankzf1 family peptidyl-tRNA hydrolase [Methylomirabilota bacterium]|nr:Vms1/Ankzf1 family peptidyl-tRNA hydrolase [Methylomirabilota bacterium]
MAGLEQLLDRLAAFEPTGLPFLSLYVDMRPDNTGRPHWLANVRKELGDRARSYGGRTRARAAYDADAERALAWLTRAPAPSTNAVVVFACESGGVFETAELPVPLDVTDVAVGRRPHLYPLARLLDRYRRYAVVVTDTHLARIFVVALGRIEARGQVENAKLKRTDVGGWSQARYQRHVDEHRAEHVREVVAALEHIVREERVDHIALAGNETSMALLRAHLTKPIAGLVTELPHMPVDAPDSRILRETLEILPREDARDDAERVARMYDAYRAGGLAIVGLAGTRAALENGQVHELLLTASPDRLEGADGAAEADELVVKARQTDARVTFVEDPSLLAEAGGVGALLRFRLHRRVA